MFPRLPNAADTSDSSRSKEKETDIGRSANNDSSSGSIESDQDEVDRIASHDREEIDVGNEKAFSKQSTESKRPPLSRVASRLTTHSITDPGPPPDGGLKAWTQVAMGWLAILATWGWINCFGVFQTYYTLHLPVSQSTISWIGTTQTFLTFFIGAFSGRLSDSGFYWPLIATGMTLQLLGIFTMSLCTKYWQLLLTQGILTGLGGGIYFTPCMGVLATYFLKRRAFAMGVASTGTSAGGLVYPVIVRQLLPRLGFAWTARVLGFVNLGFLATIVLFMRPRLPPRKSGPVLDWRAFKEVPYLLLFISVFFQVWCAYFTLYYITSFGIQKIGMSFHSGTVLVIIVNGIGMPPRLLMGIVADKWGQLNTITPCAYILALVTWCWIAVHSSVGVYVFVCVYGIVVGAYQCLLPSTVAKLTDDMTKIGSRLGMVFSSMGLASLTGPPIGGAIIEAMGGSYVGAQSWAAASCVVCAVGLTMARISRAKGKLKVKV